jgi:Flp pilus assembly protein TadG
MTTRCDGDRGSLLPEFALAAPLMVFMLLGIYEFGMGYRERINLTSAVRSAARQATNLGEARQADYEALQGYRSTMARAKNITVNKVVIYKATSGGAPTDASCFSLAALTNGNGVDNHCNIYSNNQLQNLGATYVTHFAGTGTNIDNDCASTAWDRWWCPAIDPGGDRVSEQGGPPDYLGVYTEVTYESYTGLLPGSVTMTDRAVMRIEPKLETT